VNKKKSKWALWWRTAEKYGPRNAAQWFDKVIIIGII